MKTNDYSDLVAGYLTGTLSEAERAAFEEQVASDPELAAALTAGRRLERELKRQRPDIRALVEAANAAHPYVPEEPPAGGGSTPRNRWPWWVILVIGVAAIAWFFLRDGEPSPTPADISEEARLDEQPDQSSDITLAPVDSLRQEEDRQAPQEQAKDSLPPSNPLPERDLEEETVKPLSPPIAYADIAQDYMQVGQLDYFEELSPTLRGNVDQAARNEKLTEILASRNPSALLAFLDTTQYSSPQYLLARGMAQFELEQYQSAAATFNELTSLTSRYQQDAQWYLVLSQLGLLPEQREVFDRALNELIMAESSFTPLAIELSRRLSELEE